tara:strand:+ start:931 stop:1374 length:444 start_codon:yes stop_codon:yes gene_type:complete
MAVSDIEKYLLAQAQLEAENQPSLGNAVLLGGSLGALTGAASGQVPVTIGNQINKIKDAAAASRGMTRSPMQKVRQAVKPGPRMAGGLVGLILGGALGAGIRNAAIEESNAARLLAKLQTEGQLDPMELESLQNELSQIYSQPMGMA